MSLFSDARVRLLLRAILAGVIVAAGSLQVADEPFSKAALYAAGVTGFWAIVETFTPLNALVGWLKPPPA